MGAGHLPGTALPVGGENTHCVLAAHRGLPSARLFSDIDQLEEGDMIYLHILGEVHAYQVENILPMVPKDDFETLNKALRILHGQDWLSLMTCTPYGINTHRLIVQAKRVAYNGEDDAPPSPSRRSSTIRRGRSGVPTRCISGPLSSSCWWWS